MVDNSFLHVIILLIFGSLKDQARALWSWPWVHRVCPVISWVFLTSKMFLGHLGPTVLCLESATSSRNADPCGGVRDQDLGPGVLTAIGRLLFLALQHTHLGSQWMYAHTHTHRDMHIRTLLTSTHVHIHLYSHILEVGSHLFYHSEVPFPTASVDLLVCSAL